MIELVPLCVAELGIGRAIDLGTTPAGRRLIGLADGGRFDGDRLHAKVAAVGADWLVIGPDGTGLVDARLLLETDEGALIHVTYQGRVDTTGGMRGPFYTAPLFETAANDYAWLNRVVAVAKGIVDGRTLRYEMFELH
jgi:hypothetical protein